MKIPKNTFRTRHRHFRRPTVLFCEIIRKWTMRCSNRDSCTVKSEMDNAMFESRFLHGYGFEISIWPTLPNQNPGIRKAKKSKSDATSAFSPPHRAETRDYPPRQDCEKLSAISVFGIWVIIRRNNYEKLSARSDFEKLSATFLK